MAHFLQLTAYALEYFVNPFLSLYPFLSLAQMGEVCRNLFGYNDNINIGNFKVEVSGKRAEYFDGYLRYDFLESLFNLLDYIFVIGLLESIFFLDRIGQGYDLLFEVIL